jgi:EPS-associated MarR family transcriptional regulator
MQFGFMVTLKPCGSNAPKSLLLMAFNQTHFGEDVQFRILRALEANPLSSQRELSREVGVSLGAVNFCLNALIDLGHVKINNFRGAANKWGYAYLLTPTGVTEKLILAQSFLRRKIDEYDALRLEIEAVKNDMAGG